MANAESKDRFVLGGDIGGTNANFCIAKVGADQPEVILKKRESTTEVDEFSELVTGFLNYAREHQYYPEVACFAVAGPVENLKGCQRVKMTNTKLFVDSRQIIENTTLKKVLIINDFAAISYAINVLKKDDFITINHGSASAVDHGVRAVLGAGTGLGKNILYHHDSINAYLSIPSEGGHADLPLLDAEELKFAEFIKKINGIETQVCYEDVLSGKGLEIIYKYLQTSRYPDAPENLTAVEISKTKNDNPCSGETFEWFIRFYARCARNFALDALARGGVYIAGGIAAKNTDAFRGFADEFVKNEVYHEFLREIPIYLITNYDISLIGCAYALLVQNYI
jgi:glucokinase